VIAPTSAAAVAVAPSLPLPLRVGRESLGLSLRLGRRLLGPLRSRDVVLLLLAGALWLAPGWLPGAAFPLLLVVWWRRQRARGGAATGLDRPIWLLLGLGALALLPSPDLPTSLTRLLGLWLGAALCLAVFDRLCSEKAIWLVVSWLGALGVLVALAGLVGTDWSPATVPGLALVYDRLPRLITFLPHSESGALNPHKLAAALAMLVPLPAALTLFTPGRLLRLGWGAATGLMLATLLLTQSGSGLVAAAVALLAVGAAGSHRCRLALPVAGAAAAAVLLTAGAGRVSESLLALPLFPGGPATATHRLQLWGQAIDLIRAAPLLGIGIGTFPQALAGAGWPPQPPGGGAAPANIPHAHNLYLQLALDLGLPGLLVFLVLIGGALNLARLGIERGGSARARGLVAGAAGGILAYLAYGLIDAIGPGEKPGLFLWLLLGVVAAGARVAARSSPVAYRDAPGAFAGPPAAGEAPPRPVGSVIYLSAFEWDYHTARPQQLAGALAERVPVLYVETTGLRGVGRGDLKRLLRRVRRSLAGRYQARPGVWVFSPLVLPLHRSRLARRLNRLLLRDAIRGQAADLGLIDPLLLISVPTAAAVDLVGHLGERAAIYDCMDDLTAIPSVDPSVGATEAALARSVDTVVAASDELRRLKSGLRQDIVVVGQGVDAAHFAAPTVPPPDLSALPRPRLLCVGGIDDRIDFALLDEIARLRPAWSIVLLGPELYLRAATRLTRPNVHLLGRRPYGALPAYLQAADVCLIPYRDTPWARACNPVKTLEYLAAGRPVVSTDLPAVRPYLPLVRVAHDAPGFVATVESALAEDTLALRRRRHDLTERASWSRRADDFCRLAAGAPPPQRAGRR
jgi:O-antigen ligase/glycosyltransferase involved in cell wall biosynthesis